MIKAERVKAGLLQSQLADKLGLAYRYVRVLERGFQRIPLKHVDALVAALPGLNAKKLRAAIEREANRVMLKNADAVQRLSGILDGNNGTVVVLGSLGADFPSQRMLEALNGFLQTEGNHVAFIVPPDDGNWAFGQDSGHGNVSALSIKLSCGNPCVARRVDFYSPVLPKYKRTAGQIQSLSQLLHPSRQPFCSSPKGILRPARASCMSGQASEKPPKENPFGSGHHPSF